MTILNGADNTQSLEIEYLAQIMEDSLSEVHYWIYEFCKAKNSKAMLTAKGEVDKHMLTYIKAKVELEYIEKGWK